MSLRVRCAAGMKRPGSVSRFSRKIPSRVILALMLRSAEQDTPMPTGQPAPCRAMRMTRASRAKYFPPNWAPMPVWRAISRTLASHCASRNARPSSLPDVGSASR